MNQRNVPQSAPSWASRFVLSLCLALTCFGVGKIVGTVEGPVAAEVAVQQLEDSAESYAIGAAAAKENPHQYIWGAFGIVMLFVWGGYGLKRYRFSLHPPIAD